MTWKDEIKKEERIEDIIAFDLFKLGNTLSNATFELALDDSEEYALGKKRFEMVKELRGHLYNALEIVEQLTGQ